MAKKTKQKKDRPNSYEPKVSIDMPFEKAIKFLAKKANESVEKKQNSPNK